MAGKKRNPYHVMTPSESREAGAFISGLRSALEREVQREIAEVASVAETTKTPRRRVLKTDIIRMRVTAEQKQLFSEAAEIQAIDLSAWLRQVALRAAGALKG